MKPWLRRSLLGGAVLIIALAATTALVLQLPQFGGRLAGERLARAQANPNFHDGVFANPLPPASYSLADTVELLQGQLFGKELRQPPSPIPVVKVDPAALAAPPSADRLRAFWIGHASVYVEIDGIRLLVDPDLFGLRLAV